MRLSSLQKYILKECYNEGGRKKRDTLTAFYVQEKDSPKPHEQVKIVTQSIERLIEKGLMVGYGMRTPEKWFIREIKLTPFGRRIAKKLMGEQQRLPMKY